MRGSRGRLWLHEWLGHGSELREGETRWATWDRKEGQGEDKEVVHARARPVVAQCRRGGGEVSGPEGEGRMSPVSFSFLKYFSFP